MSAPRPGAEERRRLQGALIELVGERGYSAVTLEALLARAGLGHLAFNRHFRHLDEAFALTWRDIDAQFQQRLLAAYQAESAWRDQIRAGLAAALDYLAADPNRARFYVVEGMIAARARAPLAGGPFEHILPAISRGEDSAPDPVSAPGLLAEGIAGAILHRASSLIRAGRAAELPDELPELMYIVVLPYLGPGAAREELRRAAP